MGLRCSDILLGVYGFDGGTEDYRQKLMSWLNVAQDVPGSTCVLMCHPALLATPDNPSSDPIHDARLREYKVLASQEFADLLTAAGTHAVRGGTTLSA